MLQDCLRCHPVTLTGLGRSRTTRGAHNRHCERWQPNADRTERPLVAPLRYDESAARVRPERCAVNAVKPWFPTAHGLGHKGGRHGHNHNYCQC